MIGQAEPQFYQFYCLIPICFLSIVLKIQKLTLYLFPEFSIFYKHKQL